MSLPQKTFGVTLGDVLKWEVHPAYCRVGRLLHNDMIEQGGSSGDDAAMNVPNPVGQPMKVSSTKYVFVRAGDEANATHICLEQKAIIVAAGGDTVLEVAALRDAPAIVATKKLPANDIDGNALNWTTIKAQFDYVLFKDSVTQIEEP